MNELINMRTKAIILNHYPERVKNIFGIVYSLHQNGLTKDDIYVLVDHQDLSQFEYLSANIISSSHSMPIDWWMGIGMTLDCEYVALINDDMTIKPKSIEELEKNAELYGGIDVFGYEGGELTNSDTPYTDSRTHTVKSFEKADVLIRFYFARRQALVNAEELKIRNKVSIDMLHDDLLLSLSNSCGIIPTTDTSGFTDLSDCGVGMSKKPNHYDLRNRIVTLLR